MKKFPIYLNFDEIYAKRDSLKTSSEKIAFYEYIINVFRESFNNQSDYDVEKYIKKYHLSNKIKKIKDEFPIELIDGHFFEVDVIFKTPSYNKLHEKTSYLVRSLSKELGNMRLYQATIEDGFILPLTLDYYKIHKFSNSGGKESVKGLEELKRRLDLIDSQFDYIMIEKMLVHFKLNKIYYSDNPSAKLLKNNKPETRINYKQYLKETYLPVVIYELEDLKMSFVIIQTLFSIKEYGLTYDVIYHLWDYDYKKVKYYCDFVFSKIEEKIKYFSYVIKCMIIDIPLNLNNNKLYPQYLKLKAELDYLHTVYKMDKSSNESSKSDNILNYDDRKLFDPNYPVATNGKQIKTDVIKKVIPINSNSLLLNSKKLVWLGSKEQLRILFSKLQKYGFVEDISEHPDRTEKYFSVFSGPDGQSYTEYTPEKIIWNTPIRELAYLIDKLASLGKSALIKNKDVWVKTSNVFLQSNGNPVNSDSMGSLISRKTKFTNKSHLDQIISVLRKVNTN